MNLIAESALFDLFLACLHNHHNLPRLAPLNLNSSNRLIWLGASACDAAIEAIYPCSSYFLIALLLYLFLSTLIYINSIRKNN